MSLPHWYPENLGRPTVTGYTNQQQPRTRRLQVMDGAARYRRTSPNSSVIVDVQYISDDQRVSQIKYFIQSDLQDGSSWFTIPLLLGTGRSGNQVDDNSWKIYEAHLVGEPTYTYSGSIWWQVNMQLELRHSPQYPLIPPDPGADRWSDLSDANVQYAFTGMVMEANPQGIFQARALNGQVGGMAENVTETCYNMLEQSVQAYEIVDLALQSLVGTGSASVLLETSPGSGRTAVPGIDHVSFDTFARSYPATSANILPIGGSLCFEVDQTAGAQDLSFRVHLRQIDVA